MIFIQANGIGVAVSLKGCTVLIAQHQQHITNMKLAHAGHWTLDTTLPNSFIVPFNFILHFLIEYWCESVMTMKSINLKILTIIVCQFNGTLLIGIQSIILRRFFGHVLRKHFICKIKYLKNLISLLVIFS